MADVFISYKREDRALTEALAAELNAAGRSVWFDAALVAGAAFGQVIKREIDSAQAALVIWSESSAASEWVYAEAKYAADHGKLIPVYAPGFDPNRAPPPFNAQNMLALEDRAGVQAAIAERAGLAAPQAAGFAEKASHRPIPTHLVDPWPGRGDFTTIAAAVQAAAEGDRILIRPGEYEETIRLDKALELIGEGERDEVVLRVSRGSALHLAGAMSRIAGLSIRREEGEGQNCAVWITKGRHELINCRILSRSLSGVEVKAGYASLRDCVLSGCKQSGAHFRESARGLIEGCTIRENALSGVSVKTESSPTIRDCLIAANAQAGVHAYEQGGGVLERCEIRENGFSGVTTKEGGALTLRDCRIVSNKQSGVFVHERGGGVLEGCEIRDNGFNGVAVGTGGTPTVRRCRVNGNGRAGVLVDKDSGGVFEENDFSGSANGVRTIAASAEARVVWRDNRD